MLTRNYTGTAFSSPGWILSAAPILFIIAGMSAFVGGLLGAYLVVAGNLPPTPDLNSYKPHTMTKLYADDGSTIGVYYNQKRYPLGASDTPEYVKLAFVAAEDARFFQHKGVDVIGIGRALVRNLQAGDFAQGGSTITQQVVRNLVLTREKTIFRKMREIILAYQLEASSSKDQILQAYINEIYLGRGAYGVSAAAETYFGKSVHDLTLGESALVAALAPNPTRYSSTAYYKELLRRKKYVLKSMLKSGYIGKSEYSRALKEKHEFNSNPAGHVEKWPYFTVAVKQYLVGKYGASAVYDEGLEVWTTLDPKLQEHAEESLRNGVLDWEKRQNRPAGLVKRLTSSEAKEFLADENKEELRVGAQVMGVVSSAKRLRVRGSKDRIYECAVLLPGNRKANIKIKSDVPYAKGDVLIFTVKELDKDKLVVSNDSLPPVQGALVSIENNTGYVRALVGGTNYEKSNFNRAVQGLRQPGSVFKPIIYSAGLEWGSYAASTVLVDEPIAIKIASTDQEWLPMNADGQFRGRISFRNALAQSRNIVAVKLLMDIGTEAAVRMARTMGIKSTLGSSLSLSLGTYEVTPMEITSAYTVFPNLGVRVPPVMVKKVVDRFGNVLEDNTTNPLNVGERIKQDLMAGYCQVDPDLTELKKELRAEKKRNNYPELIQGRLFKDLEQACKEFDATSERMDLKRAMSPQTAYVMTGALRDVVTSGTGTAVSKMKRSDLAGKTGTTDDYTDAWFIGFNPKVTTGVWVGYDTRISLGKKEAGSVAALPIWMDYMQAALKNEPDGVYPVPPGIVFTKGGRPSQPEKLLSYAPDFAPNHDLKRISPIDDRLSVYPEYAASTELVDHSTIPSSGSLRVYGPEGSALGYSAYYANDKGVLSLFKNLVEYNNYRTNLTGRPPHKRAKKYKTEDQSRKRISAVLPKATPQPQQSETPAQ